MPVPSIIEYEGLRRLLGADLEQRLAAVEAQLRGEGAPRPPSALAERNASAVADGHRLRAAIGSILTAHQESAGMTGKPVLRALGRQKWAPLPSLRTVRWHMQQIRGNGSAAALPPD